MTEYRRGKRPGSPDNSQDRNKRQRIGIGGVVAAHYNNIQEKSIEDRFQSSIIHMRSFNNWIKSMLISSVSDMVRGGMWDAQEPLTVLDIGVGKGGDLGKWSKHGIKHLIGFDIASESLACCKSRFQDMQRNSRRFNGPPFTAEFYEADFTRDRLKDMINPGNIPVDIVSCQFSFHYCFESFAQADHTLANVSECLKDGGYFMLTFPDAYNIVHRWKAAGGNEFGNRICKVNFGQPPCQLPLFGAKYRFSLEGVVDCPEFLVYFPALVEIAKRNGLTLVYRKTFKELFDEHSSTSAGRGLLGRMQALETYPSGERNQRNLESIGEYEHAKRFVANLTKESGGGDRDIRVGTLSKSEWEAASLYTAAVFKKPTMADRAVLSIEDDD